MNDIDLCLSYDFSDKAKSLKAISEEQVESLFEDVVSAVLSHEEVSAYLSENDIIDEDIEAIEIDLYFCNNEEIQEINLEYRSKDEPTDVLTFCMLEEEEDLGLPMVHLGEIILSVEKLTEQAEQNNHTFLAEFVFLLSHGLLHLIGMHHDEEVDLERNIRIQTSIVSQILKK